MDSNLSTVLLLPVLADWCVISAAYFSTNFLSSLSSDFDFQLSKLLIAPASRLLQSTQTTWIAKPKPRAAPQPQQRLSNPELTSLIPWRLPISDSSHNRTPHGRSESGFSFHVPVYPDVCRNNCKGNLQRSFTSNPVRHALLHFQVQTPLTQLLYTSMRSGPSLSACMYTATMFQCTLKLTQSFLGDGAQQWRGQLDREAREVERREIEAPGGSGGKSMRARRNGGGDLQWRRNKFLCGLLVTSNLSSHVLS